MDNQKKLKNKGKTDNYVEDNCEVSNKYLEMTSCVRFLVTRHDESRKGLQVPNLQL
jgi:hypothetical protein